MVPEPEPKSEDAIYDAFTAALRDARPELGGRMRVVKVEWGHELPNERPPVRDDHQLTLAEQFAFDRVGYHNVRKVQDSNNVLRSGIRHDMGIPVCTSSSRESAKACSSSGSATWSITAQRTERPASGSRCTSRY